MLSTANDYDTQSIYTFLPDFFPETKSRLIWSMMPLVKISSLEYV